MDKKEFQKRIREYLNKIAKMIIDKNNCYANDNALSGFANDNRLCDIETEILTRIFEKIYRIINLRRSKKRCFESISDNIDDIIGYCAILRIVKYPLA